MFHKFMFYIIITMKLNITVQLLLMETFSDKMQFIIVYSETFNGCHFSFVGDVFSHVMLHRFPCQNIPDRIYI